MVNPRGKSKRGIENFAKLTKFSKKKFETLKFTVFRGCKFQNRNYSNFSIENYSKFSIMNNFKLRNFGQISIFIILTLVIISGIILYFVFREGLILGEVPKQFEPVYNYYLECIENEAQLGALIAGEHAGFIENPEFSAGSFYMPFSSQLDFLDNPVPYWYYISGNGLVKEQIPSKELIEQQLNKFVEERIINCDFSQFVIQGYRIEVGEDAEVDTRINDNNIKIFINHELNIYSGEESFRKIKHEKSVSSSLGKSYDMAIKIYDSFKESMFLENYGVDILRLYAPVDGTEIGCKPLLWNTAEIRENLTKALEANIGFIKLKGDYYNLRNPENNYFVHDIGEDVQVNVNFLYLREWPLKMQVWPSEDGLLRADPAGLEEGFGMLGFCYVPYHFVYDFAYPVLIQMYYNDEIFQFPVVVYINKNRPREPIDSESIQQINELCQYKNTKIKVHTYNNNLDPIEADISFKCFDSECNIGKSVLKNEDSELEADFPQCVNGYIVARSEGYETGKYIVSTVNEQEISVVLNKEYNLDLDIRKSGGNLGNEEYAIISFKKENNEKIINYPEQKRISLSEGQYQIKAYVYSNIDIPLTGDVTQKCVEVPKSGIFGYFGATEEKCFDLEIPSQDINVGISGGGTQEHYITEPELKNSKKIIVDTTSFGIPSNIKDLQLNYNLLESSGMNIRLE